MSLTKPNQQLRRDLKEAAAPLNLWGADLTHFSVKLSNSSLEHKTRELRARQSFLGSGSACRLCGQFQMPTNKAKAGAPEEGA